MDQVARYRQQRDGTRWRRMADDERQPVCPMCERRIAMVAEGRMELFIRALSPSEPKLPPEGSGDTYHRVVYHAKCGTHLLVAERPRAKAA